MTKLTINKIAKYTTDKNGNPLKTKDGRPYTSLRIKANEYGDKWLSGFDGPQTQSWKEGSVVEVEVTEKGEYLNFSVPKKDAIQAGEISALKTTVGKLDFVQKDLKTAVEYLLAKDKSTMEDARNWALRKERGYDYPIADSSNTPDFEPKDFAPDF